MLLPPDEILSVFLLKRIVLSLIVKDQDRLSVVTYDTGVYLDFGLMKTTKDNKAKCLTKIQEIRYGSTTNLSGGLLKGLEQISSRTGDKNEVASVLLFTDGLANHGKFCKTS